MREFCRLLINDKGKQYLTMPDGTIIPAQILTRVSQDTDQYIDGIGYGFIKVWVDLKPINMKKDDTING